MNRMQANAAMQMVMRCVHFTSAPDFARIAFLQPKEFPGQVYPVIIPTKYIGSQKLQLSGLWS